MKVATPHREVRTGQLWNSATTKHRGWTVVVTKVSVNSVHFEAKGGPSHARKSQNKMYLPAFLATYTPSLS